MRKVVFWFVIWIAMMGLVYVSADNMSYFALACFFAGAAFGNVVYSLKEVKQE